MRELKDKVVVITGGASGIGRALADRFAAEGSKVVLADIEPGALEEAAAELRAGGTTVLAVPTDVSRPEQVQALCDRTVAEFGRVDVVCNNAGVAVERARVGAHAGRLGMGARREPVGRDPRRAHVRARDAPAGRRGTHRQHGLGRRAHQQPVHEHLQRRQARGGHAVRDPAQGSRAARSAHQGLRALPGLRADPDHGRRAQPTCEPAEPHACAARPAHGGDGAGSDRGGASARGGCRAGRRRRQERALLRPHASEVRRRMSASAWRTSSRAAIRLRP